MAAYLQQPASHAHAANLRHDLDLSTEQLIALLDLSQQVKQSGQRYMSALKGRYVCLLFEKPSLRTRMTFELAIKQLGGDCVTQVGSIAEREPLKDVARNLARWTDAIVARTFTQETIDELARWSGLPVINALSDLIPPVPGACRHVHTERAVRPAARVEARLRWRWKQCRAFACCCARRGWAFKWRLRPPRDMSQIPEIVEQARELAA